MRFYLAIFTVLAIFLPSYALAASESDSEIKAKVILTNENEVSTIEVSSSVDLAELLTENKIDPSEYKTSDGEEITDQEIKSDEEILLLQKKYFTKFKKVEIPTTNEKVYTTALPAGEEVLVDEGELGHGILTSKNEITEQGTPQRFEYLTVVHPPTPGRALVGAEDSVVLPDEEITPESLKFSSPLSSGVHITSPYGMRNHPVLHVYKLHDGVDLTASCGQAVTPVPGGIVTSAKMERGYGNRVIVDHGNGVETSYSHLSAFHTSEGAVVTKDTEIAEIGSTGYSTGCHLHFMVEINGQTLDPAPFLGDNE